MKRFFSNARLLALSSLIVVSLTGYLPSQSANGSLSQDNKPAQESTLEYARENAFRTHTPVSGDASLRPVATNEITNPGCLAAEKVNICTIVKNASPSIVLIKANQIERDLSGSSAVSKSIGSGFFVCKDLILTNNHVVGNAPVVTVELANGKEVLADILIRSESRDLAILKVNKKYAPLESLPPPLVLSIEEAQVGKLTIALGHPRGLEYVVATFGRVSATGIPSSALGKPDSDRKTYIQTDTAINPGNSGGPLLDSSGKVIGVNAAIMRDAEGIAFSLEKEHILWILDQLGDKQEKRGLVN